MQTRHGNTVMFIYNNKIRDAGLSEYTLCKSIQIFLSLEWSLFWILFGFLVLMEKMNSWSK